MAKSGQGCRETGARHGRGDMVKCLWIVERVIYVVTDTRYAFPETRV